MRVRNVLPRAPPHPVPSTVSTVSTSSTSRFHVAPAPSRQIQPLTIPQIVGIRLALVASTLATSRFRKERDRRAGILGSMWGLDYRRVIYRARLRAAEKES
jgi:hypothetical protein